MGGRSGAWDFFGFRLVCLGVDSRSVLVALQQRRCHRGSALGAVALQSSCSAIAMPVRLFIDGQSIQPEWLGYFTLNPESLRRSACALKAQMPLVRLRRENLLREKTLQPVFLHPVWRGC